VLHALGLDLVDREAEPDEQTFEVVFAGLVDLLSIDMNVVDGEQIFRLKAREIEAERAAVDVEVGSRFVEGHEHAGSPFLAP